jgi:PAS domain S-box-containing protein
VFAVLRPHPTADGPAGPPSGQQTAHRWGVGRIVLLYALFGTLWILLSDRAVRLLFRDPLVMMRVGSVKGLFFVLFTSTLLFITLNRHVRQMVEREAATRREEWEKIRAVQLLGVLSEASPDAMYIKDDQGRYLLFNHAAGRMVGKDPAEVIGKDDRDIFPVEEALAIIAADRRVLDSGAVATLEESLTTTTGLTTFLTTKGPIRDPEGKVSALFGIARDITMRKQIEEDLRASEEKFSNIFHMSPDAVDLTHMESGVLLELNQSYVNMFGYARDELLGHSTLPADLGIWVRAEDREHHVAELRARGIVIGRESLMRRKDGGTFFALISSSVLEIKGERCNLSMARDITDQKRAEEALRESSRRLELATASARLGIWDRNLVEGTSVWNDRMYEMYGLDRQAVPPSYRDWCRDTLHPEDRAAMDALVQAAIAGDRPYDAAFRIVRPDGAIRHIKSNGHVLRDAGGRAIGIIGINQDLTPQVEAEAEQRRLQSELQHAEKLESLGSLAGGVAHDMNNVLAAIMGMASALRATHSDQDPQAKPLDTITRACARGRDVVKSLLYFARKDLEAAGPVNLNAIAQEMVQLLSHTTLRRVQISTDFQEPLGLIEGDGGALSHALINLCVNAVDSMPDGGTLWIQTRRSEQRGITISIRDSGEGMSPELIRQSVEPFFTTKPVGKGTGLGLAMVYGTVKAHKGSFEIRSEPGQGTEVILGFPPLPGSPAEQADPPQALVPAAPMGPIRILLVDDDELIRMSIGPMLGAMGHQVHTAEAGLEALERIQGGLEVDLVILDMNMPGLNGAQTLTRLLELRPGQTVLMATGYSDESIAPLLDGRPNVFSLRKPFSLEEIRTMLGSMPGLQR